MKFRAILKRRWPIVALCVAVGAFAGVVSSQFAQRGGGALIFSAQQVILAKSGSSPSQDALKVTRGPVLELATKTLESPGTREQLASKISATFDSDASAITIASTDADPKEATRRVEAFVQAFLQVVVDEIQAADRAELAQIDEDLLGARDALTQFDTQHPELTQPGVSPPNDAQTATLRADRQNLRVRIVDLEDARRDLDLLLRQSQPYEALGAEAAQPVTGGLIEVPASAPTRGGLIGLLGLLFGAGLAMVLERVRHRIDTREELAGVSDLPILAEVSFLTAKQRGLDPGGRLMLSGGWAEPTRRLRSAVQFVQSQEPWSGRPTSAVSSPKGATSAPAVFMVTSTSPGEGKSTTAVLLSMALAEVGVPTVLIGGDFRKPQIDRQLGVPRSPSLRDLAVLDVERPSIDEVVQQTDYKDLYVAVAGEATREVAGMVEAVKAVCAESVARGATVIIDSSPIQAANDALDLLPIADYVILVVRAGKSTGVDLLDTISALQRMESKILGFVLTGTHASHRPEYYDYFDS